MILPYAISIPVYSDPGHAWGAVRRQLLMTLDARGTLPLSKISPASYQRGGMVYLEEDCDLTTACDALRREGFRITMEERGEGESSWIRSLPNFSPTLAPMPSSAWLVFAHSPSGPILRARGDVVLSHGAIPPQAFMTRGDAEQWSRICGGYAPIRAASKRAHTLCLARGYTYSQPVRQTRG